MDFTQVEVLMGCGGCGGGNRSLRKVYVQRPQRTERKKTVVQQKVRRGSKSAPKERSVNLKRQALVKDDRCPQCGHPVMLVNIAGRERKQCTSCRYIVK